MMPPRRPRFRRDGLPGEHGIPLRAVAPNVVTALALCSGLTGIRYAITGDNWPMTAVMVMTAALLDGLDGRVARLIRGESRFGAELDSLSDAISFGVSPALILYLWSLVQTPRIGWIVALVYAVFCALRLARFNAQIDAPDQPRKALGYLTGIPAPAGAALAMVPLYLWLWIGLPQFRSPWLVAPWLGFVAFLMISNLPTYGWTSFRLRRNIRFELIVVLVVLVAVLFSEPWATLSILSLAYLAMLPFSIRSYRLALRQRKQGGEGEPVAGTVSKMDNSSD